MRLLSDKALMNLIVKGNKDAFTRLYDRYASPLFHYCSARISSKELSEEIVQEIFVSLWANRSKIFINKSVKAYLFKSCQYKILSYMRSDRVRRHYMAVFARFSSQPTNVTEEQINLMSLKDSIEMILDGLPDKCQTAFRLSRVEYLPIHHIAKKMNISKRTVENYLSKALKHLRTSLVLFN